MATPRRRAEPPYDLTLVIIVLLLLGVGIVMVYSASSVEAYAAFHDSAYYLKRQLVWTSLGLVAMASLSRIDYHRYVRLGPPLFVFTIACLVLVLIPHVGVEVNGARRWLGRGSLLFQPSELAKLAVVLMFAVTLTFRRAPPSDFWRGLVFHLGLLIALFGLILKEPDLGTALSLTVTAVLMMFVAGAKLEHLGGLFLTAVPAVGAVVVMEPYRLRRILAFVDPFKDPLGAGYHILQGLYAIGSGGLLGTGLGNSALKYFYLPEAHTDFIFAILAEELGFVGAACVIGLFCALAWRGFRIALLAPDRFGAVLGVGLTTMVIFQAVMNIAVVTDSMPVTGVPLPFISYGGSSLVFTLAGIGMLLNLSRQSVAGG